MSDFLIRELPDDVYQALCQRAQTAGRSAEDEARAILILTCMADAADLRSWTDEIYGHRLRTGVVDELISERRAEARREAEEDFL